MDNKVKITAVAVLVIAAAFVVGFFATSNDSNPTGNVVSQANQEASLQSAPAFSVQTIEGKTVSTQENKKQGKPMIVYFMASTCSSCAKNWDNINQVYPEFKDKVDIVAVSVDPTDDAALLQKLAAEKGFTFEVVPGNPELAIKYDVKKQTAKFAIDKDGNIVSRHDGVLSAQEWKELMQGLM